MQSPSRDSRFYHFNRQRQLRVLHDFARSSRSGLAKKSSLPCEVFFAKTLQTLNTTLLRLCETKTTDPTGRRIKKKSDLRETGKKFSETSTPSPLKSA